MASFQRPRLPILSLSNPTPQNPWHTHRMTATMIREAFALTPPFWWPVLVVSILALRGEMARAEAAGYTHGRVWLLRRGRLWLELAPPLPELPAKPRPDARRVALARALSGDTDACPVTRRVHWPVLPMAASGGMAPARGRPVAPDTS